LGSIKKAQNKQLDHLKREAILDNYPVKRAVNGWEHQGLSEQTTTPGEMIQAFRNPPLHSGAMEVQANDYAGNANRSFSGPFGGTKGVQGTEYGEYVDGSFFQPSTSATGSQATGYRENTGGPFFEQYAGAMGFQVPESGANVDDTGEVEVQEAEHLGKADNSLAERFANDGWEEYKRRLSWGNEF
jgi:hypothetical protein